MHSGCSRDSFLSAAGAKKLGHKVGDLPFFDTVRIDVGDADKVVQAAVQEGCNLRKLDASTITVSLDETTRIEDIDQLFKILNGGSPAGFSAESLASEVGHCCTCPEGRSRSNRACLQSCRSGDSHERGV